MTNTLAYLDHPSVETWETMAQVNNKRQHYNVLMLPKGRKSCHLKQDKQKLQGKLAQEDFVGAFEESLKAEIFDQGYKSL